MFTKSLWNAFSSSTSFEEQKVDLEADVAIIGGGVTGITTGMMLARMGKRVVILEALKVGGGTTSHSTGNLYFTIDRIFSSITSKYDEETLAKLALSRKKALKWMRETIQEHGLDCDYREVPWYLFSGLPDFDQKIEEEYDIGLKIGIDIEKADESDIPVGFRTGVKVPGQGQINSMRYVQELAKVAAGENCRIYECTRVKGIEEEDGGYTLSTTGGKVRAKDVVHATHVPKGVLAIQTLLGPYREYGIAARLESGTHVPPGIFWGYPTEDGIKVSFRNYERNGEQFLIVVGQPHKVGQAEDNRQKIRKLEAFARENFPVREISYRWGGQHYRPADFLPYIGRHKDGIWYATGYSTDGLVWGTLAGMIISDGITGKENQYAKMYDPGRTNPLKSAKNFLKENLNVAGQYIKDLPFKANEGELADLAKGEGRIIVKDRQRLAVYKGEDGKIQVLSAVCPHMECIVHWNNAENTWDCPCHGSRFDTDGTVLEGPSFHPLEQATLSSGDMEPGT